MSELWNEFLANAGRAVWKWPNYFPIYEKHLARFKNTSCTMLEIGCGQGGSLQLWKKFLGPHAEIVGIDIKSECKDFEEDQVRIFIGNQSDTNFLAEVIKEVGVPDIVLDDGGHYQPHVSISFDFLYPRLPKNGVYMVEDLHCAYIPECCDETENGNFIELSKKLIDSLNALASNEKVPVTEFTKTTHMMAFYENMVVFEKGIRRPYKSIRTGQEIPGWVY
jgi:23S rRNA U2552 (ribose-2'-O)-methylase RlmE/FtsJ